MDIIISNSSPKPIYEQIYTQIKDSILRNEILEGEALPSMRVLAQSLRISVITTKRAYEDLERDGFIYSVVGQGSFVKKKNLAIIREESLKKIEEKIQEILILAQQGNISEQEIREIVKIIKGE